MAEAHVTDRETEFAEALRLSRRLKAPREAVFRAFTDPAVSRHAQPGLDQLPQLPGPGDRGRRLGMKIGSTRRSQPVAVFRGNPSPTTQREER